MREIDRYQPAALGLVRRTAIHIVTVLGDLAEQITVVGGAAPALLIPQHELPEGEGHVGTLDLDLGLSLAVLDGERYKSIGARLRQGGFASCQTQDGRPRRWTWEYSATHNAPVDFLIADPHPDRVDRRLQDFEGDFAAVRTPGLELAWRDRRPVALVGETLRGDRASRSVHVCGPASFVVLKALAFRGRAKEKDVYDLVYVLAHWPGGLEEIAAGLRAMLDHRAATAAVRFLGQDCETPDHLGPKAAARFMFGERSLINAEEFDGAAAQAHAWVQDLLRELET